MTLKIKHKATVIKDEKPDVANLEVGEIAINSHPDSAAIYFKLSDGRLAKVDATVIP